MVADIFEYSTNTKTAEQVPSLSYSSSPRSRQDLYNLFLETVNSAAVHYQPIIDIRSNISVGAEALIRPQTISTGMSQECFIRYAQENNYVPRITEVVLKDALLRVRSAAPAFGTGVQAVDNQSDCPAFCYTVNVSPSCLKDQGCIDLVNQFLFAANHRFRLILELSESNVFPSALLEEFYKKTGEDERLSFALDDFGVGQSRFETLKSSLVKWVKIDRSFLPVKEDQETFETLQAIVEFAQFFDCTIIVEGIETQLQFDLISRLKDVNLAQGFLLARPACWQSLE